MTNKQRSIAHQLSTLTGIDQRAALRIAESFLRNDKATAHKLDTLKAFDILRHHGGKDVRRKRAPYWRQSRSNYFVATSYPVKVTEYSLNKYGEPVIRQYGDVR